MEDQPQITFMRVLIEMIDPTGVDAARPPLDSVHLVTLPAAARQITAVLPRYAGDQYVFGLGCGMEVMRN